MLARPQDDGRLFIGQPAHAWLSGDLARAWGNETFGTFAPREEVCAAAAQHDIGMTSYDLAPTLNESTGYPATFMEMPRELHVGCWSGAAESLLPQSRYVALLVSLHGTGLYGYVNLEGENERTKRLVHDHLHREQELQERLIEELRDDPLYRDAVETRRLARNKRLIQVWDLMSLRICMGFSSEVVERVPTVDDNAPLMMTASDEGSTIELGPWPFREQEVHLAIEGRLLVRPARTHEELRAMWEAAPFRSLRFTLRPHASRGEPRRVDPC